MNKQNKVLLSYETDSARINVTQWSNSQWNVCKFSDGGRASGIREFDSLAEAEAYAAREFKNMLEKEEIMKSFGMDR